MPKQTAWIKVAGQIKRGHQVASGQAVDSPYPAGSIALQLPHFRARGLDLYHCYAGTLNISIAPRSFNMLTPEYLFRQVAWSDLIPPEDFSFAACELDYAATTYAGYVYYPHPETKPGHFQDPGTIEIIATLIPDIDYGATVTLRLNPAAVQIIQ